jgi:hypothetical protein
MAAKMGCHAVSDCQAGGFADSFRREIELSLFDVAGP